MSLAVVLLNYIKVMVRIYTYLIFIVSMMYSNSDYSIQ